MSLRQVLTIYRMERELNADDMALLNTIRRFTDAERETLIEGLSSKPQKKPSKKTAGKSRRASSLQSQMSSALKPLTDIINQSRCVAMLDDNGGQMVCDETQDDNIHHKQSDPDYHEFQSTEQAARASGD